MKYSLAVLVSETVLSGSNVMVFVTSKYLNAVNNFRYICGEMTLSYQKKIIKKVYKHYFGVEIGDWDN